MSDEAHLHRIDRPFTRSVVVFVHGILGHYLTTWGDFPSLLQSESDLVHYSFRFWGYPATPTWRNFIPFVGNKRPDIAAVANAFLTYLKSDDLASFDDIVLVGHSMGGLVIKQCMVTALENAAEHRKVIERVRQIALYATPSTGVQLSGVFAIDPQARQLDCTSEFIEGLRKEWLERVYHAPLDAAVSDGKCNIPTKIVVGLEDDAVPEASARDIYKYVETVPGNHSSMNKPTAKTDQAFKILRGVMLAASPLPLIMNGADLVRAQMKIVRNAREILYITGSRSRSARYLTEIENALAAHPSLQYYRVLMGPPRTEAMRDHVERVLTRRPPTARVDDERVTYVSLFTDFARQPEIFLCGNERCCIAILPPMTGMGDYTTGYYFGAAPNVDAYRRLVKEIFAHGKDLLTAADIPPVTP